MLNTRRIMLTVFAALLPAAAVKIFFWGPGTLFKFSVAIIVGMLVEVIACWLRNKPLTKEISNGSVLVTSLILTLSLPPGTPYYVMIICSLGAFVLGKHVYGGLGQNLFNPAMIGVAVYAVSYPQFVTYWQVPVVHIDWLNAWRSFMGTITPDQVDAYTSATPLTSIKALLQTAGGSTNLQSIVMHLEELIGFQRLPWLIYAGAFIFGGLILIQQKIIGWTLPIVSLVAFTALAMIHYSVTGYLQALPQNALIYGSMIFAAFFIVTDPVTAPQYGMGRIIYAALVGALTYIIRAFTDYNDGVAFAIVLSNALVPLIDMYFVPKEFGK